MRCQYCGKEVWGFRSLFDGDFCTPAHRREFAERIRRAFDETPRGPSAGQAAFILHLAPVVSTTTPHGFEPAAEGWVKPAPPPAVHAALPPARAAGGRSRLPTAPEIAVPALPDKGEFRSYFGPCDSPPVPVEPPAIWRHSVQAVPVVPRAVPHRPEAHAVLEARLLPLAPEAAAPEGAVRWPARWRHSVPAAVLPMAPERLEPAARDDDGAAQAPPEAAMLALAPAAAAPGGAIHVPALRRHDAPAVRMLPHAVPRLQGVEALPHAEPLASMLPVRPADEVPRHAPHPIAAGAAGQHMYPRNLAPPVWAPEPAAFAMLPLPPAAAAPQIEASGAHPILEIPPAQIQVMPRFTDHLPPLRAAHSSPVTPPARAVATPPLARAGRADVCVCPAMFSAPSGVQYRPVELDLRAGLLEEVAPPPRARGNFHVPAFTMRQYQLLAATVALAAILPFAFTVAQTPSTLEIEDDFRSGLVNWEGAGAAAWRIDPKGFARPGGVALFAPSRKLSDYRLEFRAAVESKGLGWVYRAADARNYHALVLRRLKSGAAVLERYSVVDGKRDTLLRMAPAHKWRATFQATLVAAGDRFGLWINGERIAEWEDNRLPQGGAGFFSEPGGRSRLYRVRLAAEGEAAAGLRRLILAKAVQPKEEDHDVRGR